MLPDLSSDMKVYIKRKKEQNNLYFLTCIKKEKKKEGGGREEERSEFVMESIRSSGLPSKHWQKVQICDVLRHTNDRNLYSALLFEKLIAQGMYKVMKDDVMY